MDVIEISLTKENLKKYQQVSIAFESDEIYEFEAINSGLGGFKAHKKTVPFFKKDYDAYGSVTSSVANFDLSNWKMLVVKDNEKIIAGAILAFNTKGIHMLRGRDDLIVIWDIRVSNEYRHKGIGSKLIDFAKEIAINLNVKEIHIETQNNNVKACDFYSKQGAKIIALDTQAYSDLKDETQIIWSLELTL